MLHQPFLSQYGFTYSNWQATPATAFGTSVTPGASNAEGAWTAVASSANIAQDCYWLRLVAGTGSVAGQQKDHLIDVGVDPAGGTSYTAIISNLVCGYSSAPGSFTHPRSFMFPIFIKSGSSVAVRVQGNNATANTINIGVKFYGLPSRPEAVPIGAFSETIGTITNSQGVAFTPGNAADGSWVSLGTTAKAMWWWNLGMQISNATISNQYTYVDLAFGDGSNKHLIKRLMYRGDTTEFVAPYMLENEIANSFCPVPAGATMYVRGRCNIAPTATYNAVAVGIGG